MYVSNKEMVLAVLGTLNKGEQEALLIALNIARFNEGAMNDRGWDVAADAMSHLTVAYRSREQ